MSDEHLLNYSRQSLDKEDIRAVTETLSAPFLTTGPRVEAFETALCKLTGADYAVACSSGTAALHLACMAIGIGPGDVGLTSPISFLASANCMEYCGAKADFIDIDPDTLCLSSEALEAYCRKNSPPKVVIPVDLAGVPADLPGIRALSRKYGFKIIEDASHALGSAYHEGATSYGCGGCAHSDLAVFSFHPVKNITTGEGGAVMTNDRDLAVKLRRLRSHGMVRPDASQAADEGWLYEMHDLGYNYRITDIQCALGISQLKKLSRFKARRQQIVSWYNRAFQGHSDLVTPPKILETDAFPHLYSLRITISPKARATVYRFLKTEAHIQCQVHYIPIYLQPYYAGKYGYKTGKCPEAEAYYAGCLSLPLFPDMTDDEVRHVITSVFSAISSLGTDT